MGRENQSELDLDALYQKQVENYGSYADANAKIAWRQQQMAKNGGAKFARDEQKKAEIESLKAQADNALVDYYANELKLRENGDNLSQEQLARFDKLNASMLNAVNHAGGSGSSAQPSEPTPPPEPPIPAVVLPIVQTYVNAGMKITCPFASGGQVPLVVTPEKRVMLEGTPMANIMDNKPITNIPPIGMCTNPANPAVSATAPAFTPKPCLIVPAGPWKPGKPDVLVGGQPALLNTDTLQCSYGGVVFFLPQPPAPPTPGAPGGAPGNPFVTIVSNKIKDLPKDKLKEAAEKAIAKKASEKIGKKLVIKLLSKMGGLVVGGVVSAGEFAYKKAKGEKFDDPLGFGNYLREQGLPDGVADVGSHVVSDTAETGKAVAQAISDHNQRLEDAGMKMGSPAHVRWMAARH